MTFRGFTLTKKPAQRQRKPTPSNLQVSLKMVIPSPLAVALGVIGLVGGFALVAWLCGRPEVATKLLLAIVTLAKKLMDSYVV